jgi:hypothetical protein
VEGVVSGGVEGDAAGDLALAQDGECEGACHVEGTRGLGQDLPSLLVEATIIDGLLELGGGPGGSITSCCAAFRAAFSAAVATSVRVTCSAFEVTLSPTHSGTRLWT